MMLKAGSDLITGNYQWTAIEMTEEVVTIRETLRRRWENLEMPQVHVATWKKSGYFSIRH
jgi:hypothetical protein